MAKEERKNGLQVSDNSVPNRIQRYINKVSEARRNKQIINQFSVIRQYDILSVEAFRSVVGDMTQKNPKGTVFMGDINDLFQANKNRGKKEVNLMLKRMVDRMKGTIEISGNKDYKIGKMGDEIYVYIPNKTLSDTEELVHQLQRITVGELSLSMGASDNLSKGLTNALNEADLIMCENKKEFKLAKLRKVCGNNLDKIINSVVSTQLDKMRLNLDNLKEKNKADLRDTFAKAVNQVDAESLVESVENKKTKENSDIEVQKDSFKELQDKYTEEAYYVYGVNASEKLIKEYVLSQIISRHPVDGVMNATYFHGAGYKKVCSNIKKSKDKNDDVDVLVTDLSGLKAINDAYGHEEGDLAIYESLQYLKDIIDEAGISTYSDIIAKGGGNSFVLMEKLSEAQKEKLTSQLLKYGSEPESKKKLSILCSVQSMSRQELSKQSTFMDNLNTKIEKAESTLQSQSFDRKIKDVSDMKIAIESVYKQLMDLDDIQLLCGENSEFRSEVLAMTKSGFRKVIEQQKDPVRQEKEQDRNRNRIKMPRIMDRPAESPTI